MGMEAGGLARRRADVDAGVVHTLLVAAKPSKGVARSSATWRPTVVEGLTAKEQEVLRLLATRLSRREIGQRLYVSLNTAVDSTNVPCTESWASRTVIAAVARARELGLL